MNLFPDVLAEFIAKKQNRDPALYTKIHVHASESYAYSEYTQGDFCCGVNFEYDGERGYFEMGEAVVVEFMNTTWDNRERNKN